MAEGLEEKVKPTDLKGPIKNSELEIGYNSVVRGFIYLGKNVRIGNGTHIISKNSRVILEDNVDIGDINIIKDSDHLPKNKGLDIYLGEGTRTKSHVIVENNVRIGKNVYLGTGVNLGRNIEIGDSCKLNQMANIAKNVKIGKNNTIYRCTIGSAPQGLVYEEEGTEVTIGDNNIIREEVVINRGSAEKGTGHTIIGSNNKIFSQIHIAHDCVIGDYNEIISGTFLAGHVEIGNHVRISGMTGIAQFVRIGDYSFIGAMCGIARDVLPYMRIEGNPGFLYGINFNRLKRMYDKEKFKKVHSQAREILEKILWNRSLKDHELIPKLREFDSEPAKNIADFIEESLKRNRLIMRFRREKIKLEAEERDSDEK